MYFSQIWEDEDKMNSKKKGNAGEVELLHLFHDRGFPVYRNDQRYRGGLENPDLCLTAPSGRRYHCEVKRTERLQLYEAIEQAIHDANGKTTPVVLHRKNRREWVAILRLDDFLSIVGKGK